MCTATCLGIQAIYITNAKVITSDRGRGIWEQDRDTGAVMCLGSCRDGGIGQEGQGGLS